MLQGLGDHRRAIGWAGRRLPECLTAKPNTIGCFQRLPQVSRVGWDVGGSGGYPTASAWGAHEVLLAFKTPVFVGSPMWMPWRPGHVRPDLVLQSRGLPGRSKAPGVLRLWDRHWPLFLDMHMCNCDAAISQKCSNDWANWPWALAPLATGTQGMSNSVIAASTDWSLRRPPWCTSPRATMCKTRGGGSVSGIQAPACGPGVWSILVKLLIDFFPPQVILCERLLEFLQRLDLEAFLLLVLRSRRLVLFFLRSPHLCLCGWASPRWQVGLGSREALPVFKGLVTGLSSWTLATCRASGPVVEPALAAAPLFRSFFGTFVAWLPTFAGTIPALAFTFAFGWLAGSCSLALGRCYHWSWSHRSKDDPFPAFDGSSLRWSVAPCCCDGRLPK